MSDLEKESVFEKELAALINRHSRENGSNTPDFILAGYLADCLSVWETALRWREQWYSRDPDAGPADVIREKE